MTTGNIPKHLSSFAIPLILGNFFQLSYNAANPIMNIVMFFIIGICMGASVLMSEYFGAGDLKKLKREVSTTMLAGLIFTVFIIIICVLLTETLYWCIIVGIVYFGAKNMMQLFVPEKDSKVVEFNVMYLQMMAFFIFCRAGPMEYKGISEVWES